MHKKIVMLIKKLIDESPYNDNFAYKVLENPNSDGFWGMEIWFKRRDDAHSNSLVESLKLIGMVYGEGLTIDDRGSVVKVQ